MFHAGYDKLLKAKKGMPKRPAPKAPRRPKAAMPKDGKCPTCGQSPMQSEDNDADDQGGY